MPSFTATPTAHIFLDERGRAWIDDTNVKVVEIILDKISENWTAEEIREQHYNMMSLAQIYAAFSYYYDHKEDFDAEIARQEQEYLRLWAENRSSPSHQKLRARCL